MPGYEACQLFYKGKHWFLEGEAVFIYEHSPCQLAYRISCDSAWHTRTASIRGWLRNDKISIRLKVDPNQHWWFNQVEIPEVSNCIDLDLNFSPCTNLIPIRRLSLQIGEKAELTAAWLRFPSFQLEPLAQSYQRLEERLYRYSSNQGRFIADLRVDSCGFALDYPGIWMAEAQK